MKTYNHFIDGQYVEPIGKQWMDTINPYTGKAWAKIPQGCAKDVDRAVAAAKHAMTEGPFSKMTATERGKMMLRLADLVTKHAERLAEIEVQDNGKLIAEMRGQMNYHPEWWRYYGGLADKVEGSVMPIDKPDIFAFTRHEPVGVVGAIIPWNYPSALVSRKVAPSMIAGDTIVLKPHEITPLSALEMARIFDEAEVPAGVVNIVCGAGGTIGQAMSSSPDFDLLTMTGSVPTGKRIMKAAAEHLTPVSLELGGKAPFIVMPDCDLDLAVRAAATPDAASRWALAGATHAHRSPAWVAAVAEAVAGGQHQRLGARRGRGARRYQAIVRRHGDRARRGRACHGAP
jgi:aldehyde dehydrogenase (NAD+)